MKYIIFLLVSTGASFIGGLCGFGGGVIIKPILDVIGIANVATISFLSSCTVLTMSAYSVFKSFKAKASNEIEVKTATPLAIGAIVGGIIGNIIFNEVRISIGDSQRVGAIQATCLAVVTVGTILYTFFKAKIKTKDVSNAFICIIIGLFLGMMSSFLGIGGGPINLVVLYYFFSMSTKKAKQNSLYIILFSQIANILTAFITMNVPEFNVADLLLMILGGFVGAVLATRVGRNIKDKTVEKLLFVFMFAILGICIMNIVRYS